MKNYNNIELVEKVKSVFKLRESPIAFFYTDNSPEEVYRPKKPKSLKNLPCIIQLLNGVRQGKTLFLGKQSRNLCPGGLTYLGFNKIPTGLEYYLSTGVPKPNSEEIALEGERIVRSPQLVKNLYDIIPFKKNPAMYAVFMPLDLVNPEIYTPLLVIFFVKMDQLAGLIQLANFDTSNRTILGISSGCGTIVTEPLAELEKNEAPRPVIGM
ncbi:unnamed protein product, partial [marine sediment metagenome]